MRVLVTVASRYGATHEIADAIGDALTGAGHDSTVMPAEDVAGVADWDAVVVGSAVYAGQWLDAAKKLITTYAEELRARPVWLFSSGPVGDPPKPAEDPVDAAEMMDASDAREHKLFAGKLDRSKLRFAEKAVVIALRAPEGDFRDFEEIRAWAHAIADQLEHRGVET